MYLVKRFPLKSLYLMRFPLNFFVVKYSCLLSNLMHADGKGGGGGGCGTVFQISVKVKSESTCKHVAIAGFCTKYSIVSSL